jgi:hypothetical protein
VQRNSPAHCVFVSKHLFGPGLLSTILSVFSCTPEPKGAPLIVEAGAGSECYISVDHKPVTSRKLLKIASGGSYTWAIVRMHRDAPYKCVGATIITLQQAGFTTIKTEVLPGP